MPGAILSHNVIDTHDSVVMVMCFKKVNKQVEGKLRILNLIRGKRERLKGCETREVPCTCRYTSEYLIPNFILVI